MSAPQTEPSHAQWKAALDAVMPADFKCWHQNAAAELPEIAVGVIRNLRQHVEDAWQALEAQAQPAAMPWKWAVREPGGAGMWVGRDTKAEAEQTATEWRGDGFECEVVPLHVGQVVYAAMSEAPQPTAVPIAWAVMFEGQENRKPPIYFSPENAAQHAADYKPGIARVVELLPAAQEPQT